MKMLALIALAAAATGCGEPKRMTNKAFMDECDACRARGYACAELIQGWTMARTGVQCAQEPDHGKANLQAMLQIAVPLDARTEKGKRK